MKQQQKVFQMLLSSHLVQLVWYRAVPEALIQLHIQLHVESPLQFTECRCRCSDTALAFSAPSAAWIAWSAPLITTREAVPSITVFRAAFFLIIVRTADLSIAVSRSAFFLTLTRTAVLSVAIILQSCKHFCSLLNRVLICLLNTTLKRMLKLTQSCLSSQASRTQSSIWKSALSVLLLSQSWQSMLQLYTSRSAADHCNYELVQ